MKRRFKSLVTGGLLAMLVATPCYAQTMDSGLKINNIYYDNKNLSNQDLLPARFIMDKVGGKITYNAATKTYTLYFNENVVTVKVDSKLATANEKELDLYSSPQVIDGTLYVSQPILRELGLYTVYVINSSYTEIIDPNGTTKELLEDIDDDGLNYIEEAILYKTYANMADTDSDGLLDGEEVNKYGTDPNESDSDFDGLTDYEEVVIYKSNPHVRDSDSDGLNDYLEAHTGFNPNIADTDGDGENDAYEKASFKDEMTGTVDGKTVTVIYEKTAEYLSLYGDSIGDYASTDLSDVGLPGENSYSAMVPFSPGITWDKAQITYIVENEEVVPEDVVMIVFDSYDNYAYFPTNVERDGNTFVMKFGEKEKNNSRYYIGLIDKELGNRLISVLERQTVLDE